MKNYLLHLTVLLAATLLSSPATTAAQSSERDWWQDTVFYQIYPRSFMDSDGDGVGDLRGITARLRHLADAGVRGTWLSPIFKSPMVDFGYDIEDYMAVQPEYGSMEDFEGLIEEANRLGIGIVLDFVPNHSSDRCEWFQRSAARDPEYEDFYVWHDGKENPDGGRALVPNNWQSVFYGSAWTFHEGRGQYYLHQFTKEQPDLNFRNPAVVERMKYVMRFWLGKGVAGFRVDAVNHLFEVEDFRDEPETGTDRDPLSYGFTHHYYTKDLPEVYDMVYQWRYLLDDWTRDHGGPTRIMMTEAYANITFTMKYYRSADRAHAGSHMPFNFLLITDLNQASTAQDFVYTINKWLTYMPRDQTANWVIGNHDQPRVGSRYGVDRIDVINTLLMTLPGIAVTYYGEEIGMVDYKNVSGVEAVGSEVFIDFSRDPERTPFQWDDGKNAGFSSGESTWLPVNPNYVELNLRKQKEADRSHYKTYQELVKLRKHDTFRKGTIEMIPYNDQVVTFVRELPGQSTFVTVLNLGPSEQHLDLSLFTRLAPDLKVAVASSRSNFRSGDAVQRDRLTVGAFDSLVLQESENHLRPPFGVSLPGILARLRGGVTSSSSSSSAAGGAGVKDMALIASILIALGAVGGGCWVHFGRRHPLQKKCSTVQVGVVEGHLGARSWLLQVVAARQRMFWGVMWGRSVTVG